MCNGVIRKQSTTWKRWRKFRLLGWVEKAALAISTTPTPRAAQFSAVGAWLLPFLHPVILSRAKAHYMISQNGGLGAEACQKFLIMPGRHQKFSKYLRLYYILNMLNKPSVGTPCTISSKKLPAMPNAAVPDLSRATPLQGLLAVQRSIGQTRDGIATLMAPREHQISVQFPYRPHPCSNQTLHNS